MKRTLIAAILLALAIAVAPASALAGAPAGSSAPAPKPASTAKVAKSGARLDEVHIKGEIPEPQVLFVVGRERRRFLDFQHRRYLAARTAAGAAEPAWVRVTNFGMTP